MRAARFHFERDRRRFTVSRAALRLVLASYLGDEAHLLRFSLGPRGKPALNRRRQILSIEFNLTHSQDLVLVAVGNDALGVDVEFLRPIADLDSLAEQVFSRVELRQWQQLSQEQRCESLLRCWTRKEAYLKAIGYGLSIPMPRLQVGLSKGSMDGVPVVDTGGPERGPWSLYDLTPAAGFLGALATAHPAHRITNFTLDIERLVNGLASRADRAGKAVAAACTGQRSIEISSST